MLPKRSRNDPEMISKRSQNDLKRSHVLKKKAETEIPPPFDLAVPILTDSGPFFAPFLRPVASMSPHFGTVGLPEGVPGLPSFWCPLAFIWHPWTGPWERVPNLFLFSSCWAPFVAPFCFHFGSKFDAWSLAKSHRFSD